MDNFLRIIRRAVVTERATNLKAQSNQYVFQVIPGANKQEIKQAVEHLFKVKVSGVNTMHVRGKMRRMGMARAGRRTGWKKAIVTLPPGQEIKAIEESQ